MIIPVARSRQALQEDLRNVLRSMSIAFTIGALRLKGVPDAEVKELIVLAVGQGIWWRVDDQCGVLRASVL
jgi:hypothetical protein